MARRAQDESRGRLHSHGEHVTATPLERPSEFAGKEFLTDEEAASVARRSAERYDDTSPDKPLAQASVQAVWWLDYGTTVVGTKRSSLIVDPPDGRVPPLTPAAQKQTADRFTRADANSIEYRFTVDDPTTWTKPWTVTYPMVKAAR